MSFYIFETQYEPKKRGCDMREIKFRAWDGEKMNTAFDLSQNPKYWWEGNKDYPLMQYTGLKDKNGVEIYEGDILDEYGYVATFVDGSDNASLGLPMGWYEQRDDFESFRQLEVGDEKIVIGNIYENPELMEATE